jgi:hypothetical protein
LAKLLRTDEELATEARFAVAWNAVEFAKQQFEYLQKVKDNRPLTEEERRYARDELGHMMHSIESMFRADHGTTP